AELLAHEVSTGTSHDFQALCARPQVQRLLSDQEHKAILTGLKARSSVRTQNLLLACAMPHASDWLLAPPIPGLGLSLQNDNFRTALKFRLGLPLFDIGLTCSATSSRTGDVCGEDTTQGCHAAKHQLAESKKKPGDITSRYSSTTIGL